MTAPTMHALFDGSDHGLIAGSALDRARHEVELIRAEFAEHEWTRAERAVVDLLAEHEALLKRVADAPVAVIGAAPGRIYYAGGMTPVEHGKRVRILAEPGEVGS